MTPPPPRASPFTLGIPVPFDYFVGRATEVEHLRSKAAGAAAGRLQVLFVRGERGIGKTSLVSYARTIAESEQKMVGIHVFLGGVSTLTEMARKVFDRILKVSEDAPWHEKVLGLFGTRVRRVGVFNVGIEFGAPPDELERLVEHFADSLRAVLERMDERNGLFLILDEIDDLAHTREFAYWLKSLVDEIATADKPLPLCLVLVGYESQRRDLIGAHESLARVFDVIDLKTWSTDETSAFFKESFAKVGVAVEAGALTSLSAFSGGFPTLAQEIGDAAFSLDTDQQIDHGEAVTAIWNAAEVVGKKLLEPQVYAAMRSQRYRSIFRRLSGQTLALRFKRKEVEAGLTAEEKRVLDNFLRKMKDLGVIEPDPEAGPGGYRFTNILHSLYFFIEAGRANAPTPPGSEGEPESTLESSTGKEPLHDG